MGWCGERQRYLPILRSQKARAARQKASSKVVQKMIYAEQARKRIKFREEGDTEADAKRIALLRKRQKQPFLDWFGLYAVTARNRIRRLKSKLIMRWNIR